MKNRIFVPKSDHRTVPHFDENTIICNILKENPKVKKSAIRFDLYQEGLTVGEYIEKCGKISPEEKKKAKPDIKWDYARKFISFR